MYRENMYRSLNDDIKVLSPPSLSIYEKVVASLYPEYNLQCMCDPNIAPFVLIREVHPCTGFRQL